MSKLKEIGKKIAGVFVESDESSSVEKQVENTGKSILATPNILGGINGSANTIMEKPIQNLSPVQNVTDVQQPSSQDLDKFARHFDELFDNANLPGPDYYEFIKMSEAMGNLPDNVKFPAVFNALKIQGLSKASLLSSAQEYIKIIDNDAIQFNAAIDQKVVAGIELNKNEIEKLRNGIQSKSDMITALQNEIVADQNKIQQLSDSIQKEESKLTLKISSYKKANENKKSAIEQDIQKINTLIQ